ncbi:MAG: T9SS type A sorting domain-containing protein [Ignavibacteria bacterium]|nr:T9SS type A sorting domain-containing protein [Ignavibacteria bacterium]
MRAGTGLTGMCCAALALLPLALLAQNRIEGRVLTVDSLAVRNAVVLLRPLDDTAQVARQLTDSLGRFSFDVTPVDAVPAFGQLRLDQNYPNPFAEHTTLTFAMPSSSSASLAVYDLLGRRVRALRDGLQPAGEVLTVWDGRDEIGRAVPSGVYVAVLRAAYGALSRMLLRGEVGAGATGAAPAGRLVEPPTAMPAASTSAAGYRIDVEVTDTTLPRVLPRRDALRIAGEDTSCTLVLPYAVPEDLGFPSGTINGIFFDAPWLYVAARRNGLWRRDMRAMTPWVCLGLRDANADFGVLDVDARGGDILAACFPNSRLPFDSAVALWHSTDDGLTWERADTAIAHSLDPRLEENFLTCVKRSPHDPATIFAMRGSGATYLSHDGGVTWRLRSGATGVLVHLESAVWWNPSAPGDVYTWTNRYDIPDPGSVDKWAKFGDERSFSHNMTAWSMTFPPGDSAVAYLADGFDLQRSADAGRTWNAVTPKAWMSIRCILHDRSRPLIYAICSLEPSGGMARQRLMLIRTSPPRSEVLLRCDGLLGMQQDTSLPYLYGWTESDRIVRIPSWP